MICIRRILKYTLSFMRGLTLLGVEQCRAGFKKPLVSLPALLFQEVIELWARGGLWSVVKSAPVGPGGW